MAKDRDGPHLGRREEGYLTAAEIKAFHAPDPVVKAGGKAPPRSVSKAMPKR